ncbi:MAG: hypothetical protein A2539_08350 [Elusimicrobia bacterium RIFOXYD2_FULL_34_15]|nr:MAG: hypothetical protein A2539_08350 [Elusimicrobia bacterium RIFOXYD2_FULL_34_15]
MLKYRNIFLLTGFLLIINHLQLNAELKVTPVANLSLLGGQYFLEGEKDSFAGNADVFFSPVISFSEKTALLPIYQGLYSNTKDVKELVGGGTLTRKVLDNSLTLKGTHKISDTLKVKAKVGYKIEYLQETKDEKLGEGLFDYNRLAAGIEGEKLLNNNWNIRSGYDFYIMSYPNYASLITTFQTSIDTATYTEISKNAGKNVLDYSTHELFIEAVHGFSEKLTGKVSYDIAYKGFEDQAIVNSDGSFSSSKRTDLVHLLSIGIYQKLEKVSLNIINSVQYYDSNQNSFDANRTQYNANYYDFFQNDVMPSLVFELSKGFNINLWWDIAYRQYTERPAQDVEGNYKTSEISQITNTTGVSVIVPVYKSFAVKVAGNYRDSSSNNKYEANYRYNYNTSNYFAGINWEY